MTEAEEVEEVVTKMDGATLRRLSKDLKSAAKSLTPSGARQLVDFYYAIQDYRIQAAAQKRVAEAAEEPSMVVTWLFEEMKAIEGVIKGTLDSYTEASEVGRWSKSITGIGPVIAAGLLAHIDVEKAPTVGHVWSFAGLNPTVVWEKKAKRPWNAKLKVLCWKLGESFVKVSGHESDVYGKVYAERKAFEIANNDSGKLATQAAAKLEKFKIGKDTEAYKAYSVGKLPPAHVHARAKRYAVKLFLAHWHHVAYMVRFKKEPPKPYVIEHGGHTHFIAPPNWPMIEEK